MSSRQIAQSSNMFLSALQQHRQLNLQELAEAIRASATPDVCPDTAQREERLALYEQLRPILSDLERMISELHEAMEASEQATHRIIEATELVQQQPNLSADVQSVLGDIVQHCAFQDISGQRLKKIEHFLNRIAGRIREESDIRTAENAKGLLDGPALDGSGLSQDDIDRLMKDM